MWIEWYKWPENELEKSGVSNDIPRNFEWEKNNPDSKKIDEDNQKKQKESQDNQLNVKIEETIDTFEDLSWNKLDEKQKEELKKLLQDTATKSGKSGQYLWEVTELVKEVEKWTSYDDLKLVLLEINNKYQIKWEKQVIKWEKQEVKWEEKESNDMKNNLKNLESSFNNLDSSNPHYWKIKSKIHDLMVNDDALNDSKKFKEEYDSIINLLKTDENAFVHIAEDLQNQDKANWTNKYSEFKNTLLNIDRSAFTDKIDRYEWWLTAAKQKIALWVNNIDWVNISDNKLSKKTDDWYSIELWKEGRKLSLNDSEYKIGSKLDINTNLQSVVEVENNTKKELKALNEELNTISGIIDFIDQAIANEENLEDVKQEIKSQNNELYNELNIDNMGSLEEIKDSIVWLYKQKEEEKEEKLKQKKRIVDEIVEKNALNAREKDEKVQDTLKFLKSIWFDLIPQDITDNIISQLNSNSWLRNMLWFNSLIDFENWNLGIDSNGDSNNMSLNEKVKFAEIFNTMIWWDDKWPININALRNASWSPISNTSNFNVYLVDNKLKDSWYASSIMLRNLEKFAIKGK